MTLDEKVRKRLQKAAPCPDCGRHTLGANRSIIRRHHWFVECAYCHCCGPTKVTLWRAVKGWNQEKGSYASLAEE